MFYSPKKGDGLTNSPTGACKLLIINKVEAKGLEPSMKNIPACKAGAVANFATPPLNLCYPIILPRIRFRRKSLRHGILTITIQYRQNLYHQLWHNMPFSVTRRWPPTTRHISSVFQFIPSHKFVAPRGVEPRSSGPKPDVIPIYHRAMKRIMPIVSFGHVFYSF